LENIHRDRRIGGSGELKRRQSIALNAEVFFGSIKDRGPAGTVAVDERAVDVEKEKAGHGGKE
jgi:hypothetical protein